MVEFNYLRVPHRVLHYTLLSDSESSLSIAHVLSSVPPAAVCLSSVVNLSVCRLAICRLLSVICHICHLSCPLCAVCVLPVMCHLCLICLSSVICQGTTASTACLHPVIPVPPVAVSVLTSGPKSVSLFVVVSASWFYH